jgi:hypothetical protein
MFSSVAKAWNGVLTNNNNVKELVSCWLVEMELKLLQIPEFFYLPEFLVNSNKFEFGRTSEGKVDDVVLPPWAKSAEDFIRLHR